MGSALLAAVGAGIEDDLAKAAHTRYRADERFRPDAPRHRRYQGFYQLYRQLYPALRDSGVFAQLSTLRQAADTARSGE